MFFRKIIYFNNMFGEVSPNINFPIFFLTKFPSLKVYKMFLVIKMQKCIQNPVEHLRWSFLEKC